VHLAYIWIVSHLSAKNYQNWWKFDNVLIKTNLLSFFGTRCRVSNRFVCQLNQMQLISVYKPHDLMIILSGNYYYYYYYHYY